MRALFSEIEKHFAVTILYFALLSVAYIAFNGWGWPVIFLWLGALIGAELPDLDHIVYAFITYRDAPTSLDVRRLIGDGRYREAFSYIAEHHKSFEPPHLVTHNCVMQVLLYIFAFCMVVCSGNLFWIGLVMSVLLHLLEDIWEDLRNHPERLKAYIFRHFPHAPHVMAKAYVIAATALFALLSILVIFPAF